MAAFTEAAVQRDNHHMPRPEDFGPPSNDNVGSSEDKAEKQAAERRRRESAKAAELRAEIEADERAKQREIELGLRDR